MFNQEIEQQLNDFVKNEDCYKDSVDIYVFPQLWGSTTLGYTGWGGSAMRKSHTIVFYNNETNNAVVSYGGRFIRINNVNSLFIDDLKRNQIMPEYKLPSYCKGDMWEIILPEDCEE